MIAFVCLHDLGCLVIPLYATDWGIFERLTPPVTASGETVGISHPLPNRWTLHVATATRNSYAQLLS